MKRSSAFLLLALLPLGCASATPGYAVRKMWIHKDVVVISVYLDRRLEVDAYLRIVDREVAKLRSTPGLEEEVPVYEVRFEFCRPGVISTDGRLATVTVRPGIEEAETPTVVLY